MSELNYLEKLLDGTEVEWKALGDVTSVLRGKRLTKNLLSAEEKFPVFHGGLEPLGYYNKSNRPANTVMIINVGASAGTVGYSTVDFWSSDGCFCLEHNELLNNRFLYFALIGYQSLLKSKVRVAGIPTLDAIVVNKLLIPIPCPENPEKSLAIQSEIVRILDKFTALTAELTAELNMRKKQYNYYRDQLLSFKEGEVEWKTLGEVAVIGTGNHDTQDAIEHGKYIFYARGREPLKLNVFDFDETAIITAGDGAGVGKVFHYAKGKYALHQRAYRIVPNAFMNPRFVYHYITAYFFTYIQKASVSSSVTSLRRPMFLKFPIPVPPSEEQARIVEILDKFDTLTNSITEGLPREIELRQKQYEYYRDLLFSFPKPETVSN
ncbi:restriction endonuclease subunit S [Escherichia coli]|uniref:restriction endonuclease subunit S n=1 Tax=Escherichia TaxID=561 RepID=UPI0007D6D04E|nr:MULTISPECIES: restriction endonuclease subunit S [Escherichia]EFA7525147.1 restriction endonuclease subunit S [Escherichia coli]EFA7530769.1 restriction endonuclease subunit S [Escherichia coli]EFB1867329.1 restriction endonuclease subunit S [Escherichia coli]EFB3763103.1 restriction endonuclease subunit S [Escherichia coli]EFC4455293.1 restriction endonuclease subunit S [Escherichia coli]